MISDIELGLSPYSVDKILDRFTMVQYNIANRPEVLVWNGARCWQYHWFEGLQPMKKFDCTENPDISVVYIDFELISWQHLLTGCKLLVACQDKLNAKGIKSVLYFCTRDAEESAICLIEEERRIK